MMCWQCYRITSLDYNQSKSLNKQIDSSLDEYIKIAHSMFAWLSIQGESFLLGNRKIDERDIQSLLDLTSSDDLYNLSIIIGVICIIDTAMGHPQYFDRFLTGRNCHVLSDEDDIVSDFFYSFDPLNFSTKDRFGLIIPRLKCVWEKPNVRTPESIAYKPLAIALRNHIWVPSNSQWKLHNLFADIKNVGLSTNLIQDREPLKIVSSPIFYRAPFVMKGQPEEKKFQIHYMDSYNDVLIQRMRQVIECAVKEQADIVVFPEMMGVHSCNELSKMYICDIASGKRPQMYILPSHEYVRNGVWYNTLEILDADGDCIYKYNKQHEFKFESVVSTSEGETKVPLYEPIESDGNVCIIHVPGIGRIGVIICSDIFMDGYLEWLVKNLKLTLLLYPVLPLVKMQWNVNWPLQKSTPVMYCCAIRVLHGTMLRFSQTSVKKIAGSILLLSMYIMQMVIKMRRFTSNLRNVEKRIAMDAIMLQICLINTKVKMRYVSKKNGGVIKWQDC